MNRPEIRASACDRPIAAPRDRTGVPCSERERLYKLPSLRAETGALGPVQGCPHEARNQSASPSLLHKSAGGMASKSGTCFVSTRAGCAEVLISRTETGRAGLLRQIRTSGAVGARRRGVRGVESLGSHKAETAPCRTRRSFSGD